MGKEVIGAAAGPIGAQTAFWWGWAAGAAAVVACAGLAAWAGWVWTAGVWAALAVPVWAVACVARRACGSRR